MPKTNDRSSFFKQQLHDLIVSFQRRSLESIPVLFVLGIDLGSSL
jgi:hypothetical protein